MGATIDPGRIHRVLFIRTDRLGETLLNLPAIAALKQALPHASLTFLVQPELAPLFQDVPGIDHVIAYKPPAARSSWARARALAKVLKPLQFDLVVISNPKKELHLAVWFAGIRWRVGYARKLGRWLLTHRLEDRKALGERHEVEYNLDLVRALDLPTAASAWRLPRFAAEQAEVAQLLGQQGIRTSDRFITIHPWSSNPAKQWPTERFRALIRQSIERLAIPVVIIGGAEHAARAHEVIPAGAPVADVSGQLSLRQLAALLQMAKLLVSNDSGPVHLAAAVNTKTLVLFGTETPATGPARWGPWGDGHAVITKPSMEAISVDEVLDMLQRQLA